MKRFLLFLLLLFSVTILYAEDPVPKKTKAVELKLTVEDYYFPNCEIVYDGEGMNLSSAATGTLVYNLGTINRLNAKTLTFKILDTSYCEGTTAEVYGIYIEEASTHFVSVENGAIGPAVRYSGIERSGGPEEGDTTWTIFNMYWPEKGIRVQFQGTGRIVDHTRETGIPAEVGKFTVSWDDTSNLEGKGVYVATAKINFIHGW